MLKGGCFCGHIRYETAGETSHETTCHCSICRRVSGAPFVTWFSVAKDSLHWLGGTPTEFPSSPRGTRSFCPRCGTALTFFDTHYPELIDVTTCSLDDPGQLPPKDHVHTGTRVRWITLADGLPQHPAARSGDG
ncbi:MAG: GFA family protein [Polyangiales bacterium]